MLKWMWLELLVVVFATCEISLGEYPYYSRTYNGGGIQYQNHRDIAPSGEYHSVQNYQTRSGSVGQRDGVTVHGSHGYEAGRNYQVLKNGQPLQTGRYQYSGGENRSYYSAGDRTLRNDAIRNENRAKNLQALSGAAANLESTAAIYWDQVETRTINPSRSEQTLISEFSNDLRAILNYAERSQTTRSSSESEALKAEARSKVRGLYQKMYRAYQDGLIPYEMIRSMEEKWAPVLR